MATSPYSVGDGEMSSPVFLLPERAVTENGSGEPVLIERWQGRPILLTLGITQIIEQESLDVSLAASADGAAWEPKPLASFPQKFYKGTYQLLLDLSERPDIRFSRVDWKVNRWGRGDAKPLFHFYVVAQPAV
jgi:hypothetical protein